MTLKVEHKGVTVELREKPEDWEVWCPCCQTNIGLVWTARGAFGASLWSIRTHEDMPTLESAVHWICEQIAEVRESKC